MIKIFAERTYANVTGNIVRCFATFALRDFSPRVIEERMERVS
jgi:hypothetical protein